MNVELGNEPHFSFCDFARQSHWLCLFSATIQIPSDRKQKTHSPTDSRTQFRNKAHNCIRERKNHWWQLSFYYPLPGDTVDNNLYKVKMISNEISIGRHFHLNAQRLSVRFVFPEKQIYFAQQRQAINRRWWWSECMSTMIRCSQEGQCVWQRGFINQNKSLLITGH